MKKILLIILGIISTVLLAGFLFLTFEFGMSDHLNSGDVAPTFTASDINGNSISLEDYEGEKVLLAFFRFSGCPICNFRVHELIENYDSLQANGVQVIAIYESTAETLAPYIDDANIPFPIISDPDATLYRLYGVDKSIKKMVRSVKDESIMANMKKGESQYDGKVYEIDGNLTRTTADIFINRSGIIEIAHYGEAIGDHIPIENLK